MGCIFFFFREGFIFIFEILLLPDTCVAVSSKSRPKLDMN